MNTIKPGISQKNALYSREVAAEYLGVKASTLAVWAATKRYPLPYVKVGRLVKYRLSDLEAFLECRTIGSMKID